ncbi:hypothetical protein GLAREA_05580 [Glarea lozoyensis ATCC 20868]|uniref:Myb-like DNA-binding domain-containing protein n=1 Tax=Glarea lozoyensis (strain ATCC 20868 / MF5171) TaxID=1116229 RepID=S3DCW5_GLAL2|nr:uncharacterized protein GLAREA_05580 [Glarea lozoyensis ATCC 20868]EPE36242.1 hypothetical protein GLAREA_05580 [Glarea lozoyensis ATCC 20868]
MPIISNDDQFKLLLSCVRHSNNGKVDFLQVARDCGIASKAAATKRYERLARIYGMQSIHRRPRPKSEYSDMQTKACMKQKLIESQEGSNTYADDEEGFAEALKPVIKVEPESIVVVKTEDHDSANHNTKVGWQGDTELMQYYDFPEIKIKEEAGEEMYKRELVHGTRCPGPSHEVCCTSALGQSQHTVISELGSSKVQGCCNSGSIQSSMKQENQTLQRPEPVQSPFAEGSHPERPFLLD